MINARLDMLDHAVLKECRAKGIEVYALRNSLANCIAFTSNNRRRREFEIIFLEGQEYRVSTRFLAYKNVMSKGDRKIITDNDPDGRRKRFNVVLYSKEAVNRLILDMLKYGFSEEPEIQLR